MDLSGIIFVLLAIAWAVFLIPKALRHHDEVARTRSIDKFSTSTRVLARREPVSDRDTRLVVTPPRIPAQRSAPPAAVTTSAAARPTPPHTSPRPSTRAAARRRRRILALLLACTVGLAVAAALTTLSWWSVVAAGGLTLAFLVLCRTQVRAEVRRPVRAPAAVPEDALAPTVAAVVEPEPAPSGSRVTVQQSAAPAPPAESGSTLWDPLPVTLPTYVTKPKAHRTVRTIDLGEPSSWSATPTVPGHQDDEGEQRQAVGS